MIIFAQNVYYIYVARFIQGVITAGIFSISQFYFVEISNDKARGLVSSTVLNTSSLGILIGKLSHGIHLCFNNPKWSQ